MIQKTFNIQELKDNIDVIDEIITHYLNGWSAYELQDAYKIPARTIYDILIANNIPRRQKNNKGK